MPEAPATDPRLADALAHLTTLGVQAAQIVVDVMKVEQRAVAAAARWLPADDAPSNSLADATQIGIGIDAANAAVAQATPRLATLSLALDRISRGVRRTAALARRIEQGWPLPRTTPDARPALLLRQAVRATTDAIRAHTNGDTEAAERLFADLNAHLEDQAFKQDLLDHPVDEMIQILCQALGIPPHYTRSAPTHPHKQKQAVQTRPEDPG